MKGMPVAEPCGSLGELPRENFGIRDRLSKRLSSMSSLSCSVPAAEKAAGTLRRPYSIQRTRLCAAAGRIGPVAARMKFEYHRNAVPSVF